MKVAERQYVRRSQNTTLLEHRNINSSNLVAFHACPHVGSALREVRARMYLMEVALASKPAQHALAACK